MIATARLIALAALCGACLDSGFAQAQEQEQGQSAASEAAQPASTATFDEEVVVRGLPLDMLRERIREAEEAMYDRFNEINSSDEYDIICRYQVELGSKIPRRRCLPNFWRDAAEDLGVETARAFQGSASINPQIFLGMQHYKTRVLTDEMEQLIRDDEDLRRAVIHLATLQQSLSDGQDVRRATRTTAERELVAGTAGLAFDAESIVQVRVGRNRWTHELTHRTFAIAQVFGEIRGLEVDCDAHKTKLAHEIGIEWTLPESWGACELIVDAKRDTTFALYEFE